MSDLSEDYANQRYSKGEKISIKVNMPQYKVYDEDKKSSKVVYTDEDLSLKWEVGDELAIVGYANGKCVGKSVLKLSIVDDTNAAIFSGNTVNGALLYDVYYPADGVDNNGNIIIDYNTQVQNGDDNTAHLKKFILLKQVGNRLTTNEVLLHEHDIDLQMQNSIMKFELSNIKAVLLQSISNPAALEWQMKDNGENVYSSFSLGINNVDVSVSKKFTGYLCFPGFKVNDGSSTVIYLKEKDNGGNLENKCIYELIIHKGVTYQPNYRYTAIVDNGWKDYEGGIVPDGVNRIYYKSNVPLSEDMFNLTPQSGGYDPNTQEGYFDFRKGFLDFGAYKNVTLRKGTNSGKITDLDIRGIVGIDPDAFSGNTILRSVNIPEGITSIAANMFSGCTSLTDIRIPNSVTSIGENAFNGCTALPSITIPEWVETIGNNAFANCENLVTLVLNAATPPTINRRRNNPLGINLDKLKIHVPAASVDEYKGARGWSKYKEKIFSH